MCPPLLTTRIFGGNVLPLPTGEDPGRIWTNKIVIFTFFGVVPTSPNCNKEADRLLVNRQELPSDLTTQ